MVTLNVFVCSAFHVTCNCAYHSVLAIRIGNKKRIGIRKGISFSFGYDRLRNDVIEDCVCSIGIHTFYDLAVHVTKLIIQ